MTNQEFAQEIQALNGRVAALNARAAEPPDQQPAKQSQALAESKTSLGELAAAKVDLRTLNDELVAAREALETERQRNQDLFEFSPDAYLVTDAEGVIREANRAAANLLHVSRDSLPGKAVTTFVVEQERGAFRAELARLGEAPFEARRDWEVRLALTDASFPSTELTVSATRDAAGQIVRLCWVLRDISERKQMEEALAQERNLLRTVVDNLPDYVFVKDTASRFLLDNLAHLNVLGAKTREQVLGKTDFDIFPEDLAARYYADEKVVIESGIPLINREESAPGPNGRMQRLLTTKVPLRDDAGKTVGLVGICRDITALKEAQEEIRRRADEFAALYESACELAMVQELPALLQTVVERAVALLGAASGSVFLYDTARGELEITATTGTELPVGMRFQLGEGMAGRVAETRELLVVEDYRTWENRSKKMGDIPVTASVAVPMLYGSELIGVLAVNQVDSVERKYSEAETRLLSLFASQAASAVHNTRLLAETHARAQQLALLYDAGLALNSVLEPRAQLQFSVNIAMKALYADRAEFFRYDPDRDELHFELGIGFDEASKEALRRADFSGGRGVAGWVEKNRMPATVPDVLNDPRWLRVETQVRSAMFVPVEHQNRLRGVLGVLTNRANAFTPQDERLLGLIANQAAVALQNARLFEETQRRMAELEAVNKISTALRLSQTLEEMLPALLDEILTILGTSAGQITLSDVHSDELHVAVARGWFAQAPEVSKADEGIRVHVMKTGQSYVLREFKSDPNTSEGSRSQVPGGWGGALVPLRAGREVIGVLVVSVPLPREIQPDEVQLLNTLAEIAGNAIHRARLHRQTEDQVRHLSALHTIDTAITASLDLRFTINLILEQVISQLKIDAADVLLFRPLSQTLEYGAGRGFRTESLRHTHLLLGEGLAGRAALERRMIDVPDLTQDPDGLLRSKKLGSEQFVAYYAAPLLAKGQIKGVLEIFHRAPLNPDQEWLDFLEALATQLAIAIDSAELFVDLQRSNVELAVAYNNTLEGWSRALDLRDKETEGHTERVTKLTEQLARHMGLGEAELVNVRRGALLHDIGKMGIPDSILLKPGMLFEEEWEIMRKHPVYVYELLQPIPFLRSALDIPHCHHEKWDGSGYPRGLRGEQIPLAARIFAIVDVWDALCSDRPYRKAWAKERALEFIGSESGKHFDPRVVQVFLELIAAETENALLLPPEDPPPVAD